MAVRSPANNTILFMLNKLLASFHAKQIISIFSCSDRMIHFGFHLGGSGGTRRGRRVGDSVGKEKKENLEFDVC